jgi:hypothetical protein
MQGAVPCDGGDRAAPSHHYPCKLSQSTGAHNARFTTPKIRPMTAQAKTSLSKCLCVSSFTGNLLLFRANAEASNAEDAEDCSGRIKTSAFSSELSG